MFDYTPLNVLPLDFQKNWQAEFQKATPTEKGVFRLVNIRRTMPTTFEELRIVVLVVDENGIPLPGVKVAFSYSTAGRFLVGDDFLWTPPSQQAFIVPTEGSGQIDQVQGSVIEDGQQGGVTVFIVMPEYSSDVVVGMGALADHTGVHLTYQLQRTGVKPMRQVLQNLEERVSALEAQLNARD